MPLWLVIKWLLEQILLYVFLKAKKSVCCSNLTLFQVVRAWESSGQAKVALKCDEEEAL
jgi:peptidyl-tRNA hydrolase